MCGIAGFTFSDDLLIKRMVSNLKHRGPEKQNTYVDDFVSLGHSRLSIIDLSDRANQPMCDDIYCIVFNGELYNYKEIMEELKKLGHNFNTSSDTEVILEAYKEWGTNCLSKFYGMWAFVIYDKNLKRLFISRDIYGKKPLFYYFDGDIFMFASEIKALLEWKSLEIDPSKIPLFLRYRYIPNEETLFKGIKKVLPSSYIIFDLKSKKINISHYFRFNFKLNELSFKDVLSKFGYLFGRSVSRRFVADVDVGLLLSGGLDSSIVAAVARMLKLGNRLDSFNISFEDAKYDESSYAKQVANFLDLPLHNIVFNESLFFKWFDKYSLHKDNPIGVPNEIALAYLFSKIHANGFKVVLSGEGSDEQLFGYGRIFRSPFDFYRMNEFTEQYSKSGVLSKLFNVYSGIKFSSRLDHFDFNYGYFSRRDINMLFGLDTSPKKLFGKFFEAHRDYTSAIAHTFLRVHLPGLLDRLDNSSMFNSVEARTPFLDKELSNFLVALPNRFKLRFNSIKDLISSSTLPAKDISEKYDTPKYLLKVYAKNKLPNEIISRKKIGFPLPLDNWTKSIDLERDSIIYQFINKNRVNDIVDSKKVFMLKSLEKWLEKYI